MTENNPCWLFDSPEEAIAFLDTELAEAADDLSR